MVDSHEILVARDTCFIGMHVAERLLGRRDDVFGIDILSNYCAASLKEARLARLMPQMHFLFQKLDFADADRLVTLFSSECTNASLVWRQLSNTGDSQRVPLHDHG
ncbi:MAG: hypothetical protein E6Q34_02695 [Burkholderiaceae bacterium]|nr:MAG: hypothetical protein E6Q34_02695 [Burkholderiaceae bacterium]